MAETTEPGASSGAKQRTAQAQGLAVLNTRDQTQTTQPGASSGAKQFTAQVEDLGLVKTRSQTMAVNNLAQALDRLRCDNSREASRIRDAALVVQAGGQDQIRKLCARGAGWDVPLRERGKKRPWLALTTELRGAILAAARRHLATGQAEPPSSLAAPAPTASASASAGQPDRISIAKRL